MGNRLWIVLGLLAMCGFGCEAGGGTATGSAADALEIKGVVKSFIDAMKEGDAEKSIPYWSFDKRGSFEAMAKEKPDDFKDIMELLSQSDVDPWTDITVGEPVFTGKGVTATLKIENAESNTTFSLQKEDVGWKVINFGIGQKTTTTIESE